MKNNTCPNCGSHEIYVSQDGGGIGDGFALHIRIGDVMKSSRGWETHLCASCGYFENFILNRELIERIIDNPVDAGWKKVDL